MHAMDTAARSDGVSRPERVEELAVYKVMKEQSREAQQQGQCQVVLLATGIDRLARSKEMLEKAVQYGRNQLDPPVFVCVAFPPATFWKSSANGAEALRRAVADAPLMLGLEHGWINEDVVRVWDHVVRLHRRVAMANPAVLGVHFIGPSTFEFPWLSEAMSLHSSFLMTFGAYLHVRGVEQEEEEQEEEDGREDGRNLQRSRGTGPGERAAIQAAFLKAADQESCNVLPSVGCSGARSGRSLVYYRCGCLARQRRHDCFVCRCRCLFCRKANHAECPHPEGCTWVACPCPCHACSRDLAQKNRRIPLLEISNTSHDTTRKRKNCLGGCDAPAKRDFGMHCSMQCYEDRFTKEKRRCEVEGCMKWAPVGSQYGVRCAQHSAKMQRQTLERVIAKKKRTITDN